MKHASRITAVAVHPVIRRLTETRLAWKLTIKDLASRIGCMPETLSKCERGDKFPSGKMLIRWAEAFDFDLALWPKGQK